MKDLLFRVLIVFLYLPLYSVQGPVQPGVPFHAKLTPLLALKSSPQGTRSILPKQEGLSEHRAHHTLVLSQSQEDVTNFNNLPVERKLEVLQERLGAFISGARAFDGSVRVNAQEVITKVPILSDMPYIGEFFTKVVPRIERWSLNEYMALQTAQVFTWSDGGTPSWVNSIAWNPTDPTKLASGGQDGAVRIWDTQTGNEIRQLASPHHGVNSLAWNPKQSEIVASGTFDGAIDLWDTKTSTLTRRLPQRLGKYTICITWHPENSTKLASGDDDGNVQIWDTQTGEEQASFRDLWNSGITSIAWCPTDLTKLAFGTYSGNIQIQDTRVGQINSIQTLLEPIYVNAIAQNLSEIKPCWVNSIAWHPTDPAKLASGGFDGSVRIWDTRTGQRTKTLTGHKGQVRSVVWCPTDPTKLASGGDDGTVRVWDTQTGTQVKMYAGLPKSRIVSVVWHPTDPLKLACGEGKTIRILSDDTTILEKYFSSNKATYEQTLMTLLLFQRYIPGEKTIVLDAIRDMNRALKMEYDKYKVPAEERVYSTLDEWGRVQKTFPLEIMKALNRVLDLKARR